MLCVALLTALCALACAQNSNRTMCFKNSCTAPIRVDYVGGATQYRCGDCPEGTLCNPLNDRMPLLIK
jgi:hypothetical protein